MIKTLLRKILPNPFEVLLKKARKHKNRSFLIPWNRGLGDIPLGLYGIVKRIREVIPLAEITFLTRPDLSEGFKLLGDVQVLVNPEWIRGQLYTLPSHLTASYDLVIYQADPTYWVSWQLGTLIPKLRWHSDWDSLHRRFHLPFNCTALHVNTETSYALWRNWQTERWEQLLSLLKGPLILLGSNKKRIFQHPFLFDLRGDTSILEVLSILKSNCAALVAPDSGILNLAYFLNTPFKLRIISLWSNRNHGILKQNVPSPNPLLEHIPMVSKKYNDLSTISAEQIQRQLC